MATTELTARTTVLHGRRLAPWTVFAAAFVGLCALTLAAAGIGELSRLIAPRLHLRPHTEPSIRLALGTWAHNMRIAGWPLLAAALRMHRVRWRRRLVDAWLAISLVGNSVLVGAAIAAGGQRLLPYLVHLPFEWAAIALAASGWILASRRTMPGRQLAALTANFALLLAVAALLETYAVPHL
jgi:hypothetical protein